MKTKHIAFMLAGLMLATTSCNDFLDVMPDSRTELDTPEKVTKLLVTAYPTACWCMLAEFSSDNTDDNGDNYSLFDRLSSEVYQWQDSEDTGNDSPIVYWSACYMTVATANEALQAIDELIAQGTDESQLSAAKGEALLCRAYGHFMLSYIFCQQWKESNKDTALGIPYSTEPETTVNPQYDRETIGKTYQRIAADIEEGLPLIDDNSYSVPKYHFNTKAAYAFAARFYLYYNQFDKAIQYATKALGDNPSLVLRDWAAIGELSMNDDYQPNAFVDVSSSANLLLHTARSFWGLYNGPLITTNRYTHNSMISENETTESTGVWGDCSSLLKMPAANYTSIPKVVFRKYPLYYFEVIDQTSYTGYYNVVQVAFSTDEALLIRAEAYALTQQYDKALADMQMWQDNYTESDVTLTLDKINDFYGNIEYYTPLEPTVKKQLNPEFTVEPGTQENLIHFILHARRITTLHEGLRWGDIRRYGMTIYRRTVVSKTITVTDVMEPDDPRWAIQIPNTVISAGLQANPRN